MGKHNILLILLLFFLFSGCSEQKGPANGMPAIQTRMAMDSINNLGSLVMVNRVRDVALTFEYARRSLQIARATGTDDAMINAYNIMGNAFSLFMMDSAFLYYTKALNVKPNQQVYPEKPMLLYNIAMLHVEATNHKNALVLLDSALQEAKQATNFIMVSNVLNALGNIYQDLGNESVAKKMYDSAFHLASLHLLPLQMGISLGNIAKIEADPGIARIKEREAIQYLKNCKEGAVPLASIYINSGSEMTSPDSAIACYHAAIGLINWENAPQILLSAYNNLVYGYLEKGEIRKAEQYLLSFAFPLAKQIKNNESMANLYDTYADVMSAQGRYKEAMQYEKRSMELLELARKERADNQVRLLGAMLDLKNKEVMIRNAQQESEQTKTSYAKARLWFAITILVVLFLTLALAFFMVRNIAVSRAKLITAAKKIILVEENEKTNLGRELHDLTGNKLLNFTNFMESASFKSPD